MRKLTVLVDMDDCIEKLSFAWSKYLNHKYGLNVPYEAINQWDVSKAYPTLTKDQVYGPLLEDDFWDWVEPIDGAAETLLKLKEDGHDVLIVTASTYHTIKAKMEKVLFRYFPFLTWDDVIITCRKHLIAGDVLVDDGIHMFMTYTSRSNFRHGQRQGLQGMTSEPPSLLLCTQVILSKFRLASG